MADIVSQQKRSEMMSGIKGKNTRPEIIIRKTLHRLGYRYRLHDKNLSGKPDLVLKKYNAVIFVHGCFWHGHDCHLFKWPGTRKTFWREKIDTNIRNDKKAIDHLQNDGWRIMTIWECAIRGKDKLEKDYLVSVMNGWLKSSNVFQEIKGNKI